MIGRVLLGIIAFILLGSFAGVITAGVKSWRTDEIEHPALINTAPGATSANVTLTRELFGEDITSVLSITSTVDETPVSVSYNDPLLLVANLDEDATRVLTITYLSEVEDTIMRAIGPFLLFMIFGGCGGAILWSIFRKRRY